MYNPILMVMQPRMIPEVMNSLKNINIEKVFFRGFNEEAVCREINDFVKQTDYTHYIIAADDIVFDQQACNNVLNESEKLYNKGETKIVTGWCNMYIKQDGSLSDLCNICEKPLTLKNTSYPLMEDYVFSNTEDVFLKNENFETFLTSFAFSCIPKQILEKFEMRTYFCPSGLGCSSDHNLSFRMYSEGGISAVTNKNMFFRHLKRSLTRPTKQNWIVGKLPPHIIREKKE